MYRNDIPSFWKSANMFGANRNGASLWKIPSRIRGRRKVTRNNLPGRSIFLEIVTKALASPARLSEKE